MNLSSIGDNVQKTAEAISSVLGVDVTVTDNLLKRVAGTGKYKNHIGETVNTGGVFAYCLKNQKSYIVRNPKEEKVCKECTNKDCAEFAEIVCPIMVQDDVMGIIGLIAFDEIQRELLLKNEDSVLKFLDKMSSLIASQIIEKKNTNEINILISQLQTVINFIEKSVIITDCNGNINYYNKKAESLFSIAKYRYTNIRDILGNDKILDIYSNGNNINDFEFSIETSKISFRGIVNARVYFNDDDKNKIEAVAFIIDELRQMISSARNIIASNVVTEFNNIKYSSEIMNTVINLAKKASKTDSTVLITGESGTGKELFARALHYDSNRRKEAFIAINCSAIPENLFESELFGYEEGAYTGALKGGHPGKFELAHKGTLLLDEIGDMPLNLQPKLLRVLQDSRVMRIGGKRYTDVDVRIIASTNCNLEEKVRNGEFREDLYYRLNVIPITVPPLRERKEDIEIIAKYFIHKFSDKLNKNVENISDDVIRFMEKYPWYGNVRELENVIEYAVSMTDKICLDFDSLPNKLKRIRYSNNDVQDDDIIHTIDELERNEMKKAIKKYGFGNNSINQICTELGMSRATFYRKLKKYNLITKNIIINE